MPSAWNIFSGLVVVFLGLASVGRTYADVVLTAGYLAAGEAWWGVWSALFVLLQMTWMAWMALSAADCAESGVFSAFLGGAVANFVPPALFLLFVCVDMKIHLNDERYF